MRRRCERRAGFAAGQIGVAVSTATDVTKSAAGRVLTEPGLGGIVAAVKEGRAAFQRILTYTINALLKKIEMALSLDRAGKMRNAEARRQRGMMKKGAHMRVISKFRQKRVLQHPANYDGTVTFA